jgi:hypothetical protein
MRLSPLSQVRSAITGKNRFPVTIRQIQAALYHCRESRFSSEGKRVGREVSGPRRKAGDTSGTQ